MDFFKVPLKCICTGLTIGEKLVKIREIKINKGRRREETTTVLFTAVTSTAENVLTEEVMREIQEAPYG